MVHGSQDLNVCVSYVCVSVYFPIPAGPMDTGCLFALCMLVIMWMIVLH